MTDEVTYKALNKSHPDLVATIRKLLAQNLPPAEIKKLCVALVPDLARDKETMRKIYQSALYLQKEVKAE